MADPQTPLIGLNSPLRGSNVGTWDTPVNADWLAIDGLFGGVQNIAISNVNISLTLPAGFTPAPSGGPVQTQNGVIRFTGAQSGNVNCGLSRTGYFIVDNQTTGGGLLSLSGFGGAGEVIYIPKGMRTHVYCDGVNVRFVDLGFPGQLSLLGGASAAPAWILSSSVPPFLACDGGIYSLSTFPSLGSLLGSSYGGNGSTTFGVPDLRGRVPIGYDGTFSRVQGSVCGIEGGILGSAGGTQYLQQHGHGFGVSVNTGDDFPDHNHNTSVYGVVAGVTLPGGNPFGIGAVGTTTTAGANQRHIHGVNYNGNTNNAGSGFSQNMPPAQVVGVWLIKT